MTGLIETFNESPAVSSQHGASAPVDHRCAVCEERPAAHLCDSCDRGMCDFCLVLSSLLPLSRFCSEECRDQAELAAEQARESDPYTRWR